MAFAGLAAAGDFGDLKVKLRNTLNADPIGSVLGTVILGSILFLEAEKGTNPKVTTFADALVFVSTSLSVGYSDIFPKTEKGKLIATALQTFGPSMTAQMLDPPHIASSQVEMQNLALQGQILDKLDAILSELKDRRT